MLATTQAAGRTVLLQRLSNVRCDIAYRLAEVRDSIAGPPLDAIHNRKEPVAKPSPVDMRRADGARPHRRTRRRAAIGTRRRRSERLTAGLAAILVLACPGLHIAGLLLGGPS